MTSDKGKEKAALREVEDLLEGYLTMREGERMMLRRVERVRRMRRVMERRRGWRMSLEWE